MDCPTGTIAFIKVVDLLWLLPLLYLQLQLLLPLLLPPVLPRLYKIAGALTYCAAKGSQNLKTVVAKIITSMLHLVVNRRHWHL